MGDEEDEALTLDVIGSQSLSQAMAAEESDRVSGKKGLSIFVNYAHLDSEEKKTVVNTHILPRSKSRFRKFRFLRWTCVCTCSLRGRRRCK